MTPNEAAGVDHALVRGASETADEAEVAGCGQPPGERRRGLEVGKQGRCGAAVGPDHLLDPLEMPWVAKCGHPRKDSHADTWLDEHGRPRDLARLPTQPRDRDRD